MLMLSLCELLVCLVEKKFTNFYVEKYFKNFFQNHFHVCRAKSLVISFLTIS